MPSRVFSEPYPKMETPHKKIILIKDEEVEEEKRKSRPSRQALVRDITIVSTRVWMRIHQAGRAAASVFPLSFRQLRRCNPRQSLDYLRETPHHN